MSPTIVERQIRPYTRWTDETARAWMREHGFDPVTPYTRFRDPWPSRCLARGHDVAPRPKDIRTMGTGCQKCYNERRAESKTAAYPPCGAPVMPACTNEATDRNGGLCPGHQDRLRRGLPMSPLVKVRRRGEAAPMCSVDGCSNPAAVKGRCRSCDAWVRRNPDREISDRAKRTSWTDASARAALLDRGITPDPDVPFPGYAVAWPATCATGHRFDAQLASILGGHGCRRCGYARNSATLRTSEEEAVAYLRSKGLDALDPFPGSHVLWRVKCAVGHRSRVKLAGLRYGDRGCPRCASMAARAARRIRADEARQIMVANGFEPLMPYPGANEPWPSTCRPAGHQVAPSLTAVKGGGGCRVCTDRASGQRRRVPDIEARAIARAHGVEPDPSVPYPGKLKPWAGVCLTCGAAVSPRLNGLENGQGGCLLCRRVKQVETHLRIAAADADAPGSGLVYLVRFVDETGTPFLKVGAGATFTRVGRLKQHYRSGGVLVERITTTLRGAYDIERRVLADLRPRYTYRPVGRGSWGAGTECFTDAAPVRLDRYSGNISRLGNAHPSPTWCPSPRPGVIDLAVQDR